MDSATIFIKTIEIKEGGVFVSFTDQTSAWYSAQALLRLAPERAGAIPAIR
jgi:hypothetical protein